MNKKELERHQQQIDEAFRLYHEWNTSIQDISDKVWLWYQSIAHEFRKANIQLKKSSLRF